MVFRRDGVFTEQPTDDETSMAARLDSLFHAYPFPDFRRWEIVLNGYPHREDVSFAWHDRWCDVWVYGADFEEFLTNVAEYIDRVHRSYRTRHLAALVQQ
jgi:hypothetical protein